MPAPRSRKFTVGTTQVSIPRDWMVMLTGVHPYDDAQGIAATFGDPPSVMLEFVGDPPEAVTVWPMNKWLERHSG